MATPKPTLPSSTPCCQGWERMRPAFGWFAIADMPGVYTLPHLRGVLLRFCPYCGSRVSNAILNKGDLPDSSISYELLL